MEESSKQNMAFTVGFFQCEHIHFGLCNMPATFQHLMTNCLKLKPSKCEFFKKKIKYLGHSVSLKGVWPSKDNLKAIIKYPEPMLYTTIKGFIGLVGHYQPFITDFTRISDPLHEYAYGDTTKKKESVILNEAVRNAFHQLKKLL